MENEFGKVKFISVKEFSQGYLLRETKSGVVLEEYCDAEHLNVETIAEFQGACINKDADFEWCLSEARQYVMDEEVVIYVDLNTWDAAINQ